MAVNFAEAIRTSLTELVLVPWPVNIWSKLLAGLVADKVEPVFAEAGTIQVAVYGNVDRTIDWTVAQPVIIVAMAMKPIIVFFILYFFNTLCKTRSMDF